MSLLRGVAEDPFYYLGAGLPDLGLVWLDSDLRPIDFSDPAHTFRLLIAADEASTVLVDKTTGVFAAAPPAPGEDPPLPNLTVAWAPGELDAVTVPGLYVVALYVRLPPDTRPRVGRGFIEFRSMIAEPA